MTDRDQMQNFIEDVARDSTPQYQPMLLGIASWYRKLGYLTTRQQVLLEINGNKQRKPLPNGLYEGEIAPAATNQQQVLSTLLQDMAAAILKAAEQLGQ